MIRVNQSEPLWTLYAQRPNDLGLFPICVFKKKKLCVCQLVCLFWVHCSCSSIIIITLLVSIDISVFLVSCHAGWGLSHMEVWRGFLVTIGWFLLFLIVAGFALRLRKWVKMMYRTINFERMTIYLSCVYSRNYMFWIMQEIFDNLYCLIAQHLYAVVYHCIMLLNLTTVTMVHAWTLHRECTTAWVFIHQFMKELAWHLLILCSCITIYGSSGCSNAKHSNSKF